MATSTEFPNNCSTNTIILQDFGEVAYIVCSAAAPPTGSSVHVPPTEKTIARLKQTEAQFRNASILAALEVESLQLFTFYKKVDVMKDQRTLLAKFGNILRSNSCTISYKAATRAPDLLKPENTKLYRLFISAILASVRIPLQNSRQTLTLGQRYRVFENRDLENVEGTKAPIPWTLIRMDLQVVTSGQVLLTLVTDTCRNLFTISDIRWQWKNIPNPQQTAIPVIIAPFGHLATYTGGWIGCWNEATGDACEMDSKSVERLKQWRHVVAQWAGTERGSQFQGGDDEVWVELQIPRATNNEALPVEKEQGLFESRGSFEFRPAFWPAKLCFILRSSNTTPLPERIGPEDPIKFVQDWFETAKERLTEQENAQMMETNSEDDAEGELFADENAFDSHEPFQSFGPPPFAASQTVYPTPPDVVMTHATPGMYSADGAAMTPATGLRTAAETIPASQELEMTDAGLTQAAAIGSGFYDEDLFEEMPGDNFNHAGAGDDPDWEFFDKPDMALDQSEPVEKKTKTGNKSAEPANGESGATMTISRDTVEDALSPAHGVSTGLNSPAESKASPVNRTRDRHVSTEPFPNFDASARSSTMADAPDRRSSKTWKNGSSEHPERRRSSIYEISHPPVKSVEQDTRYESQGVFWFDTSANLNLNDQPGILAGWTRRTPSSSSASDSSTSEDGTSSTFDRQQSYMARKWTIYQPASPEEESQVRQIDVDAIEAEAREIFGHLRIKSANLSLENTIQASKKPNLGIPKDKPGLSLLFSQLFVEQYAQSTLVQSLQRDKTIDCEAELGEDLVPDLTNLNSNATYATIGQLAGLGLGQAGRLVEGSLVRMPERQIKFKRGDKLMVASTSILPFWDTLGLQPQTTAKDVTAFCIHPPGSGLADGCANFLERVTDAYGNCSLGLHNVGGIPKMTDNGLLTWSLEREKTSSLVSIAMRLGEALALAEELSGIVVIYIVGLSADPTSYLQCCVGFYACYQAYKKNMRARTENLELVLQIVPASFVASTETIVVPSQLDYNSLALEVYGRLPPSSLNNPAGSCDFPIALADSGNAVRFNLEAQPVSPNSRGGACLHLAYAYSDDQRWLVACWTDDIGRLALTMTYLMKIDALDKGRPEKDILQDMWEVSQDLMRPQRSRWRLIVSRIGFYEIAEENFWKHLDNSQITEEKAPCILQLLSVELAPSVQISPPILQMKRGHVQSSSQSNTYGTPATSPQAAMTSPEQIIPATPTPGGASALNAPTPPELGFDANIDGELSLIDPSEESWMMMLPFGMNQTHDILGVKQAMASGYLLKRLGPKNEDGLCSIGVHLKYTLNLPTGVVDQDKEVLEDIIQQFRGLVTLAAARGIVDKVKQCVPCHIHAAVTGARGLGGLI